jgi:hypothetical protein
MSRRFPLSTEIIGRSFIVTGLPRNVLMGCDFCCYTLTRFQSSHSKPHQSVGNVQEQLIDGGACFRDDDPRLEVN